MQLPAHIGKAVDDHGYDAVKALADRDRDQRLVAVLLTADHPDWSAIDGPAWTVALATAAGVEPSTLVLAVRAQRSTLNAFRRSGLDTANRPGPATIEALDRAADRPTQDGSSTREARTAALTAQQDRAVAQAARDKVFAAVRAVERAAARAKSGQSRSRPN